MGCRADYSRPPPCRRRLKSSSHGFWGLVQQPVAQIPRRALLRRAHIVEVSRGGGLYFGERTGRRVRRRRPPVVAEQKTITLIPREPFHASARAPHVPYLSSSHFPLRARLRAGPSRFITARTTSSRRAGLPASGFPSPAGGVNSVLIKSDSALASWRQVKCAQPLHRDAIRSPCPGSACRVNRSPSRIVPPHAAQMSCLSAR